MPWWSWILIWVALIAISLLYVVLLGIRLWRQLAALGKDFAQASEKLSATADAAEKRYRQAARERTAVAELEAPAPGWAVEANPTEVRLAYQSGKLSRVADRRRRRVERRYAQGQLQSLRDLQAEGRDLRL
ncbi:hypothetical protein [Psychromicrobium xiongbiense]|uniref:hypothetical protein n=1 Tax=Psychromicrobium xiongbiense TaxID=3051184 RepID=UPI0025568E03|nr:hypothetical protein [Psychromicrobium sp. YIM S02556]